MPKFIATFDDSILANAASGAKKAVATPATDTAFRTSVTFNETDYVIQISKKVTTSIKNSDGTTNDKIEPSYMTIAPEDINDDPIPNGRYVYDSDTEEFKAEKTDAVPAVEQQAAKTSLPTLGNEPTDPLEDSIYTTILDGMNSVLSALKDADGGTENKAADFSEPDGKFWIELSRNIATFTDEPATKIIYNSPISEREGDWTRNPFVKAKNNAILQIIAGKASKDEIDNNRALSASLSVSGVATPIDGIPQEIKRLALSDKTFKNFLILGKAKKLTGDNRPVMYENLAGFIALLGAKTEFESVIDKIDEQKAKKPNEPAPSGKTDGSDVPKEKIAAVNPPPEGAGASAGTGAGAGAGTTSPGENTQTEKAVDMGDAPKKEAPSDTVLFRYTLFGANPDSTAQMRLIFNDGSALDYEIPAERIGSVNTFIVNGNNRDKVKANIDTEVTVKITAQPMGGGEAVIDTQSVYITKQLADNQIFSFRFMPSLGWAKNTGVDSRGKTVGELISKEGDVRMVFYTRTGSVSVAMCDVSAAVSGKMFKFNFTGAQPLLVPIQLDIVPGNLNESFIKKTKRLLNEAVPHWIFLKPGAGGGTGGGGAGDGKGIGDKGKAGGTGGGNKQKMNVNIAVSQMMIATNDKWIYIPNVGNPFNRESFKFAVAQGSIKRYSAIPATAQSVTLAADELLKQGYTQGQIEDAVYDALFNDSEAWKRIGGPNLNCWSKDDTVVGGSSSITSRHAYEPVRVS